MANGQILGMIANPRIADIQGAQHQRFQRQQQVLGAQQVQEDRARAMQAREQQAMQQAQLGEYMASQFPDNPELQQLAMSNPQALIDLGLMRPDGSGQTAAIQTFNAMTEGFSPEEIARARRIDAGLEAPASRRLSPEEEAAIVEAKVAATSTAKGQGTRRQQSITMGSDAAKGIPILRRSLSLLKSVKTGGLEAAQLAATNLFGVTGADEVELSANLGRNVLSQLKTIFGAQFTEKEGARLEGIESNFGKSTAGNRRLLRQTLVIAEDAANRGLKDAIAAKDFRTAAEIQDFLEGEYDVTLDKIESVENQPQDEWGIVQ